LPREDGAKRPTKWSGSLSWSGLSFNASKWIGENMGDKKPQEHEAPDWPPRRSAVGLPDGERGYGSTGQSFIVKDGQWIRIQKLTIVLK